MPIVYEELRELARRQMRTPGDAHTLDPTGLVNEVYLRLADESIASVEDRAHFRSLCARVMRRVLVDRARARNADKRGAGGVLQLETAMAVAADEGRAPLDVLALDEALEEFAQMDARKARVVELRIFSGLGVAEVAECLEVSERTVEADWFFARAWLRARLAPD